MCDELVGIFEAANAEAVRFEFLLSPEWKPSEDMEAFMPIEIGQKAIFIAKDASADLRENKFDPEQTISGLVTVLASAENPADLEHTTGSRELAVVWDGELGLIKVIVRLDPETYLEAHKAHGRGQQVEISGKLERSGRRWKLRNPHDFKVLS